MNGNDQTSSAEAPASVITVVIKLPKLSSDNLARMAAFLVKGNDVLMQSPVTANGTRFRITGSVVIDPCVVVVLGPKGLDDQTLLARTELPRLPLLATDSRGAERAEASAVLTLDFATLKLDDELVEAWWRWCRTYTISGTVQGQNGCPAPGAEVTIYNVTSGTSGLIESPIATVETNAAGQFTATFNWCDCLCCWPCWPIWWRCWPWWWELDILATIENIERQLASAPSRAVASPAARAAPLKRPTAPDLMTGQGFARAITALERDSARTALVASKFANPQIRELFPWWWWCCDSPNIVFSVTQNGAAILDEDPATATRWCFASGQSVTLVGNSQTIGVCPPTKICDGFGWVSVGNPGILVEDITNGYANGTTGTDASNMAFVGALNIYGGFNDQSIPFYQVYAGLWTGNANPARGGVAPGASLPISIPLVADVLVVRAAALKWLNGVLLGPCGFGSLDDLYMTQSQRQNPPAGVTGLGPNPFLPGDVIITWSDPGLIVSNAAPLLGSAPGGGVDLTLVAYDATGAEVTPLTSNNPLTLMIDTTGLTGHSIDSLSAYTANGTWVGPSGTTDCPSYHIGPGGYILLHVTVTDLDPSASSSLNEHLYGYEIDTQFGHGSTSVMTAPPHRGYVVNSFPYTAPGTLPGQVYGTDPGYAAPNTALVSFAGGGDTIQISPAVTCCYDFQLWAGKRVTDGESFFYTWGNVDFWTASIDVSTIV